MGRTGHALYKKRRRKLLADCDVCWLCGEWIDPELKFPHPLSASADHLDAVSRGGDNNGELAAAHLRCNQSRGAKTVEEVVRSRQPQHGRRW